MIAFGPVPSRRLGRSLGINHIPPKACTYSCAYCQVGRTTRLLDRRSAFQAPEAVVAAVEERVEAARAADEWIDYLTFVPDGEPTLDRGLGWMIRALQPLGIPIAVVTNGSLLHRADVQDELAEADFVSIKVDAVDATLWRRINRPHGRLALAHVLRGMWEFADAFKGRLVTETMVLDGQNDDERTLRSIASFVGDLHPATAYLAVPTRPPAEPWARSPSADTLTRAYEVFRGLAGQVELLMDYEGDDFALAGDPREDLLAITAVHPMREQAVTRLLRHEGLGDELVTDLLRRGELVAVTYGGFRYYVRPIGRAVPASAG